MSVVVLFKIMLSITLFLLGLSLIISGTASYIAQDSLLGEIVHLSFDIQKARELTSQCTTVYANGTLQLIDVTMEFFATTLSTSMASDMYISVSTKTAAEGSSTDCVYYGGSFNATKLMLPNCQNSGV